MQLKLWLDAVNGAINMLTLDARKQSYTLGVIMKSLGFGCGVYQSYWGGARQGSRSCACGETNPNSWIDPTKKCNCDAGQDKWHSDEGYLNSTTLLPVVEVMFKGVTLGTEANFTVGHLYCAGLFFQ